MRTLSLSLLALAATALAGSAHASTWEIDPSHTTATFSVKHMMVTNVKGQFGKVTGEVNLDDKDPTKSTAKVEIDAKTIDTREPKRDAHLKSPDFFDVEKHPTITFTSSAIKKEGKEKYKMTGDLTMRGVTKPVTLSVETTPEVKDIMGGQTRGAHVTGKINRKDWGLNWNKALEAGGVLVGDEVALDIDVEMHKKVEQPAAPAAAAPAPSGNDKAAASTSGGAAKK